MNALGAVVAWSPLSTFVMTIGALGGVQGIGARLVMAMTCVPVTLIGWAAMPPDPLWLPALAAAAGS